MTPEEARVVQDARLSAGWDWCPDDMHDGLEEDMCATIAGMRWEYAVENIDGDYLDLNDNAYSGSEILWTWNRTLAEEMQTEYGDRIVRRLAGPVEVVVE